MQPGQSVQFGQPGQSVAPIHVIQARANRWANGLLYAELAKLTPEQLSQSFGVNFGSVLGLANHTILADRVWLARLAGGPLPDIATLPTYADFAALAAAREQEDDRAVRFAEDFDTARLAETLRYADMRGKPCAEPLSVCLAQFYGHQIFHRGQLHALLGVFGIAAPDMDLIYYHVKHREPAQQDGRA